MENRQAEGTLVYGRNAVAELLQAGAPVDTVWIAEGMEEGAARYFFALGKAAGAVVKRAKGEKLDALCGGHHQGVAAAAAEVLYCSWEDILQAAHGKNQPPFLVLCDGIEDPHNLGALMRTALLCGVHGCVIPRRGGVAVTPAVVKASAGAALRLPVARVANIGETVRRLKKANVFVYCADAGGRPLEQLDFSGPLALVVGAEGKGVSALVRGLCDGRAALSMATGEHGIDSYNVSVAGGILMYCAFRQRI